MEDVVETLLGLEIVDEADSVEDMQALARQQWFKRARELGVVSDEALDKVSSRTSDSTEASLPELPKAELPDGDDPTGEDTEATLSSPTPSESRSGSSDDG
jgi:hypothetical protein